MPVSATALQAVRQRDRACLDAHNPYERLQAIHEIWPLVAAQYGDIVALKDLHGQPSATLTYRQMAEAIRTFASGLQALGIENRAHVALFADNSHRWLIADQGIMTAGGMNAVRSATAETEELLYIAEHSESTVLVVETLALLKRLRDRIEALPIALVILLSDQQPPTDDRLKILNFSQLMALGAEHPYIPVAVQPEDLATLIYTSGTT